MSLLNSIDKLRCELDTCKHVGACSDETVAILSDMVEGIEAEISERFVELPTDADGETIHIGDWLAVPDGRGDKVTTLELDENGWSIYDEWDVLDRCTPENTRHIDKPPTREELIIAYWRKVYNNWDNATIEKAAHELVSLIDDGWWSE